jgi:DNA-binding IclR family transcriptional regulator
MSENVVKSAARVLEVFEFFATRRVPASVSEVCSGLGYPQSSTSVLLKSLLTLGYLAYDDAARRYVPTTRVTLLGDWLQQNEDSLPAALDALHVATGETVALAQQIDADVQFTQVLARTGSVPAMVGARRSVVRSAAGRVLLSRVSDSHALRVLRAANADGARVEERELINALREARDTGFATTDERPTEDMATIAMLAPQVAGRPPLAVAIVGTADRILANRDALIAKLKQHLPQQGWAHSRTGIDADAIVVSRMEALAAG